MSDVQELVVLDVPVDELCQHPENPRKITDARLEQLMQSLRDEPDMLLTRPVVALAQDETPRRIVAGNQRWLAAKKMGRATVPTIFKAMDAQQAKLWMLRDNNEYGEWEGDELAQLLAELQSDGADMALSGFAEQEVSDLLALLDGPAEPPQRGDALANMEVTVGDPEHVVERGQVWRVGEHHLVVETIYEGWPTFGRLLKPGDLLVPYPTPIIPLTKRARQGRLVMVQPDAWLAGHLLDKYADVNGGENVELLS